jgi:hypothetical protein
MMMVKRMRTRGLVFRGVEVGGVVTEFVGVEVDGGVSVVFEMVGGIDVSMSLIIPGGSVDYLNLKEVRIWLRICLSLILPPKSKILFCGDFRSANSKVV